ncbi:MAG: methylenetetrahydrofolate reductase C-terminal domain-containing protein [Gemmatimonadota bacterium]
MRTGATPPSAWPRPARPRLGAWLAYRVQRLLAPNSAYRRLARWIEATGPGYRLFTATEKAVKTELFGCRMCGQCALPVTGYACPMTCPKQLRNGPCGGVGRDGSCEVFPGQRCVWLIAWERADQQGRVADLRRLQRPIDQRQWGRSSWVNYWSGRDDDLWTEPDELMLLPVVTRSAPAPIMAGQR